MEHALVSITVVTYNSGRYIARCLDAVFEQEYRPLEVIVVDNASQHDSLSILARYKHCIRLIQNDRNTGFAAGQNQAIAASHGQSVLTPNADVLVQPGFIGRLVETGRITSTPRRQYAHVDFSRAVYGRPERCTPWSCMRAFGQP